MTQHYKISVIMPCFNHGEFVAEAVGSVTNTKRSDIELIVVDDGSTDDRTVREMDSLRAQGIRVIRQENKGLASARNAAIAASQGKYLFPLDADDRMRSAWIDRAIAILDSRPEVGVVYGDIQFFGAQKDLWKTGPLDLYRLLDRNYIPCSGLYRRVIWEETGGYDGTMPVQGFEDWDLWVAALERGWRFVYLPETFFDYRKAKRSMLTHAEDSRLQVREFMAKKHPRLYQPWKLRKLYRDLRFRVKHPIAQFLRRLKRTESSPTK